LTHRRIKTRFNINIYKKAPSIKNFSSESGKYPTT
jgi:hypothetical protein